MPKGLLGYARGYVIKFHCLGVLLITIQVLLKHYQLLTNIVLTLPVRFPFSSFPYLSICDSFSSVKHKGALFPI